MRLLTRILTAVAVALCVMAARQCVRVASAHDAQPTAAQPQGWSYPFYCCSGYDCRAVSPEAVDETPDGYVIRGTGELLTYRDTRLRNSPDGEFHWCSVSGADNTRTICLFVPPRSY